MNTENLTTPTNEESQDVFELSKNRYEQEISHYEALVKEKPELAHLFAENIKPDSSTSPTLNLTEFISGHFNINTYHQYGSYPFIQISSYPAIIGHAPNMGKTTNFNGYVYGGYNMPILNFNNIHLGGVVKNAQSIINTPLNFQLYINPRNIVLRLFRGNIYLGDLFSAYQNYILITYPIVLSGIGTFNLIQNQ
ncbi:hypothetical protein [Xenorhabdus hominickii]|uniref:Uncharacterized protein n=1 Tax=Xenorhabdus hominickii TaxID=351679 RepID=A0A2G0QAJ8_XENHO|nr:hypothetical protein [Xenorhabdus hominickii]AOM40784.1 hypothetical protein A9255_09370 [Xenorhabdus hominickii]PHM56265.1 hypothetical protein Xhom_01750 [Xenorhabdus hominickii]